nr:hypothetical protein [Tanacetum cinerariifolium]
MTAGSSRPYASGSSGTSGKQRVIVCYNYKGEDHMSKQCTKPKRRRDEQWFKDKIALMANLSHYGSDNLAEDLVLEALDKKQIGEDAFISCRDKTNVMTGLSVLLSIGIGSRRGTIAVVVILVKGHTFPTSVKVRPVGCDLLALESKFTPVEDNTCVLETTFVEDIVLTAGSESRPPMLDKENYVPWSSRLLRYAKSRPNGKLIHNSILNGPYVRKMIPESGDANREITVTETFHLQTDDELFDKELKQIKADDQAIQTILLGLPEDIYAAVNICETAQEIWLCVQQMMKGSDIGIQEKKAKLFNEWERFTSNERESIESYYHHF